MEQHDTVYSSDGHRETVPGDDDACTELEARLRAELGDRRDWWLLSGGKVQHCDTCGALVRWDFPQGAYEAWLLDDIWHIRLPNDMLIITQRWRLQSTLWRAILRYPDVM